MSAEDFALTEDEIRELTGYRLPSKQLETLKRLGIRAVKLRDNTIRVLRMDMQSRTPLSADQDGPRLKSSRK